MSEDQVSVRSITGVDLTLTIAGPGSRSYAFIVDWHIRLLLSVAWLLLTAGLLGLRMNVKSRESLVTLLPAVIIYLLYQPICEIAMRGRTPGKRIAAVRLLDRNGGVPSTTALLIRNIFRLIDSLPLIYGIGLIACFVTANRVRVGDIAAGTLLVVDQSASLASLTRLEALAARSSLPLETLELVDQILERWESMDGAHRTRIANSLLARIDPQQAQDRATTRSEAELHARLRALLQDAPPGVHV